LKIQKKLIERKFNIVVGTHTLELERTLNIVIASKNCKLV